MTPVPPATLSLGAVAELEVDAVYQPIVDLRDHAVVGYEALARGPRETTLESPAALFAAARAEDSVLDLDLACLHAALSGARERNVSAPLSLFVNAEPSTLDAAELKGATAHHGLVVEVTERAFTAQPDVVLRSLMHLRTLGWGVALDDVGGDSRSLALMSILYPDVIKLDMRLIRQRTPAEIATIVTAVGMESERSRAIVLAEGIDSSEQLTLARAWGATLGQGFLLGSPGPLPSRVRGPRRLRLHGTSGDPWGDVPYDRVINWKRPQRGPRALVELATTQLEREAGSLGDTAMALVAFPDDDHPDVVTRERYHELANRLAFVGVLGGGDAWPSPSALHRTPLAPDDALRGTWTVAVLAPYLSAVLVARPVPGAQDAWTFAVSYDRDTVTESALTLMARMGPDL